MLVHIVICVYKLTFTGLFMFESVQRRCRRYDLRDAEPPSKSIGILLPDGNIWSSILKSCAMLFSERLIRTFEHARIGAVTVPKVIYCIALVTNDTNQ